MKSLSTLFFAFSAAGVAWSAALAGPLPNALAEAPGAAEVVAYLDEAPGGVIPEEFTKLKKREENIPYLLICLDANYKRCIILRPGIDICSVIPAAYDNGISSVTVSDNAFCYMWRNNRCDTSGPPDTVRGIGFNLPHTYANLQTINFNDDISSIYCAVKANP